MMSFVLIAGQKCKNAPRWTAGRSEEMIDLTELRVLAEETIEAELYRHDDSLRVRNSVPKLLDIIDALRAELAAAQDAIKSSAEYCKTCPQLAAARSDAREADAELARRLENDVATALLALAKHSEVECLSLEPPLACECCYDEGWKCFYDALGSCATGKTAIEAVNNARANLETTGSE
jgi:hypothetical protein